jgi:chromate transport protein ChrA
MAIRTRLANLTPGGQRQRFVTGVIALAAGVIAAVVLIAAGVSPGWLALLFIPFWFGSLGLVQAREKT